ncbi:MAG: alpha/beta fold hydrolase [Burkholderiales bacterium]
MSSNWSAEYTVKKGVASLYVYRKRTHAPIEGAPTLPVLFLVHGSTVSGRTTYDLQVPGERDYSVMDYFAARGFDVWTMDHEGYGRSSDSEANSGILSGAEDLRAAVSLVERETGRSQFYFFGSSSGALRAARFAMNEPKRVARLALSALVYTGEGSPTLAKRRLQIDEFRTSNRRHVDRAFYHGMFTRDKPGSTDAKVPDAIADAELPLKTMVPTGTYLDMCIALPIVDPAALACPVMVLRGEYDGIAAEPDLFDFFARLPNKDKQFVVLAGIAHNPMMGVKRAKFFHALHGFLTAPYD